MAVAFFATGALADRNDPDEISADLPAGDLTGMILVAIGNLVAGSGFACSGWTEILNADGNVASHLGVLWRRVDGSEANPTTFDLGGSGGGSAVRILALSGCLATGDVVGVVGGDGHATANVTATAGTLTPPVDGCGVLFIVTSQDALTVRTCSGY